MKRPCGCDVGPGKFEGEGAITALAYSSMLNGGSDLDLGPVSFFKAPLNFDADSANLEFAQEQGYCGECIKEALEATIAGLSLYEDSNGFVYTSEFETEEDYNTAVDIQERLQEEEDNQ